MGHRVLSFGQHVITSPYCFQALVDPWGYGYKKELTGLWGMQTIKLCKCRESFDRAST